MVPELELDPEHSQKHGLYSISCFFKIKPASMTALRGWLWRMCPSLCFCSECRIHVVILITAHQTEVAVFRVVGGSLGPKAQECDKESGRRLSWRNKQTGVFLLQCGLTCILLTCWVQKGSPEFLNLKSFRNNLQKMSQLQKTDKVAGWGVRESGEKRRLTEVRNHLNVFSLCNLEHL